MKIHIVKKGESLYGISQMHHIELDKLIAANPQIADTNVIDVGMKVKIPYAPKSVTPPTDYLYKHTVMQGESLWNLGKAWGIPLGSMIAANPQLKNPNVLMTGEIVYIPKMQSNPNPHQHLKKDTSQIAPEAPLPVEAGPISELPETPPVQQVQEHVMEKPLMPMAPKYEMEKPMMPMAPQYEMEKPMMPMAPQYGMEKPMMPMAPVMEMPMLPSFPNVPHMELPQMKSPGTVMPYPSMQTAHPYGANEGVFPAHMYPNWGKSEQQHEYSGVQHPSHHLFQQYEVPALEALAHEYHHDHGGKGKENMWAEPKHPAMQTMPQATEMPYYNPNAAHPMVHSVEQPMLGGDCGCGQPKLHYMTQVPGFHPVAVQPNEPFLAMAHPYYSHMHGPMMPYSEGIGHQPYQPPAAGSGYPAAPVHPGFGVPMGSPFGMPFPWAAHEGHDGKEKSYGKEQSRGDNERVEIAQLPEAAPAKKAPQKQSKSSSTRAAISRLIERNRRYARASSRTRRASPWLGQ